MPVLEKHMNPFPWRRRELEQIEDNINLAHANMQLKEDVKNALRAFAMAERQAQRANEYAHEMTMKLDREHERKVRPLFDSVVDGSTAMMLEVAPCFEMGHKSFTYRLRLPRRHMMEQPPAVISQQLAQVFADEMSEAIKNYILGQLKEIGYC